MGKRQCGPLLRLSWFGGCRLSIRRGSWQRCASLLLATTKYEAVSHASRGASTALLGPSSPARVGGRLSLVYSALVTLESVEAGVARVREAMRCDSPVAFYPRCKFDIFRF